MKECRKCGAAKPLSEFHKNKRHPDGVHPRCKECRCAEQRAYNAANVEQAKAWRAANRESRNATRVRRHRILKAQAIEAYGGKCACCGESHEAFLVFDHVNDDGAEHRKSVSSGLIVWWLAQNNYPDAIQLLCANCNTAKQYAPGGCPHQRAESDTPAPTHPSNASCDPAA